MMDGNKGRWYLVRWSEMIISKIDKVYILKIYRKVIDIYLWIEIWNMKNKLINLFF